MPRERRAIPWAFLGVLVLGAATAVLVVLALRPPDTPPPSIRLDPTETTGRAEEDEPMEAVEATDAAEEALTGAR